MVCLFVSVNFGVGSVISVDFFFEINVSIRLLVVKLCSVFIISIVVILFMVFDMG